MLPPDLENHIHHGGLRRAGERFKGFRCNQVHSFGALFCLSQVNAGLCGPRQIRAFHAQRLHVSHILIQHLRPLLRLTALQARKGQVQDVTHLGRQIQVPLANYHSRDPPRSLRVPEHTHRPKHRQHPLRPHGPLPLLHVGVLRGRAVDEAPGVVRRDEVRHAGPGVHGHVLERELRLGRVGALRGGGEPGVRADEADQDVVNSIAGTHLAGCHSAELFRTLLARSRRVPQNRPLLPQHPLAARHRAVLDGEPQGHGAVHVVDGARLRVAVHEALGGPRAGGAAVGAVDLDLANLLELAAATGLAAHPGWLPLPHLAIRPPHEKGGYSGYALGGPAWSAVGVHHGVVGVKWHGNLDHRLLGPQVREGPGRQQLHLGPGRVPRQLLLMQLPGGVQAHGVQGRPLGQAAGVDHKESGAGVGGHVEVHYHCVGTSKIGDILLLQHLSLASRRRPVPRPQPQRPRRAPEQPVRHGEPRDYIMRPVRRHLGAVQVHPV
mmetsp:Transcript_58072/g.155174  ORF Transcript_58072/g.155174 Transcript_58072/m.155174 type:complete len:493 (-) Transcript_58072:104-1582(-)